ncbi:MAG: hypothetical protein Q9P01_17195 [Anaerolineae bacterium]|nr:hypothetical protein [Anaerolineae bacterium]
MVDISLISIVLPTYNGERYLDESIQSVIDQTYTYWEPYYCGRPLDRYSASDSKVGQAR